MRFSHRGLIGCGVGFKHIRMLVLVWLGYAIIVMGCEHGWEMCGCDVEVSVVLFWILFAKVSYM